MKIGFIGLGRMGMNMARRILEHGHEVVAYNRTPEKTKQLAGQGARACFSLEELIQSLEPPRVVWMMLPAGEVVDRHLEAILDLVEPGDVIIDGGQHPLQGRHPALPSCGRKRGALPGRGHQRRSLGPSGRVLPHGRGGKRGL